MAWNQWRWSRFSVGFSARHKAGQNPGGQHTGGVRWENVTWHDPTGRTQASVHVLAAYVPNQGGVLAQRRVEEKSNEITHAPKLLKQLDLRGVVGSFDAMFDQRKLSIQIVQAKGDYLWTEKRQSRGVTREYCCPLPASSQASRHLGTAHRFSHRSDGGERTRAPRKTDDHRE